MSLRDIEFERVFPVDLSPVRPQNITLQPQTEINQGGIDPTVHECDSWQATVCKKTGFCGRISPVVAQLQHPITTDPEEPKLFSPVEVLNYLYRTANNAVYYTGCSNEQAQQFIDGAIEVVKGEYSVIEVQLMLVDIESVSQPIT